MEAAARVFAERGYDRASLDDVATAAGFSKGAVYSNFADKQELLFSLMRDRVERRVDAVREMTEGRGTASQLSTRAGAELGSLFEAERGWHVLFIEFWIHAVRDPALRVELAERREPMRALIARFIDEQADRFDAQLPMPSTDLASIVLALSNGLAIEHLIDPEAVDPSLFGLALELVFGGIAAGEHGAGS